MRLTKTYEDGSYGVADVLPCGENSHEFKRLVINKLAAYEELGWISVDERLPETKSRVLVSFTTSSGKKTYVTCVDYVAPRTVLEEDYMDDNFQGQGDYDEEKDCYWTPTGFYEWSYESEINWQLGEKVTHWMPLPQAPDPTESANEV